MANEIKVRLSGRLKSFIDEQTGPDGLYDSAGEYLRELIRRDIERMEDRELARLAVQFELEEDEDEDLLDLFIGTNLLGEDEPPIPPKPQRKS